MFKELPICDLCNSYYYLRNRRPFLLSCNHTYCEVCIRAIYRNGTNYCPKDKIRVNDDKKVVFRNTNINRKLDAINHVYPKEKLMSKDKGEICLIKTGSSLEQEIIIKK